MKITKADVGSTVLMRSWSRENRKMGVFTQNVVIEKISKVNITLSGNKYRIKSIGDFSLTASRGCESDSWVMIYLSSDDAIKDDNLNRLINMLSNPSDSLISRIRSLSLERLQKVEFIINDSN